MKNDGVRDGYLRYLHDRHGFGLQSLCGINVDLDVSNGSAGGWKY